MMSIERSLPVVAIALALAGCARQTSPDGPHEARGESGEPAARRDGGIVTSIDFVAAQFRGVAPAGTITGVVVGGPPADRGDERRNRTATPVAGAAGPALAGSAIAGRPEAGPGVYRVNVQYPARGSQVIEVIDVGDLRVGDRVKVDGNRIRHD